VAPDCVATSLNGHRGTGTVQEAGAWVVKYALLGAEGPAGKFISEEHNPATGDIPW
jgi:hypothetical protein